MKLVLATRGSDLARWQASHVAGLLAAAHPGLEVSVEALVTRGDREAGPLSKLGGQGLFTAEVDRALLDGRAHLAVHSLKDLPIEPAQGLRIAAIPERGPTEDVLVSEGGRALADVPHGATVGTSSPRRAAWLHSVRPDLRPVDLRGNVPTRLAAVAAGNPGATILARAGLVRLGREKAVAEVLTALLPAPGQGALAIVTRQGGDATAIAAALDHAPTRAAVEAERAVLAGLGGGCSLPLGVHATRTARGWRLAAAMYLPDGPQEWSAERDVADPRELAAEAAAVLGARVTR